MRRFLFSFPLIELSTLLVIYLESVMYFLQYSIPLGDAAFLSEPAELRRIAVSVLQHIFRADNDGFGDKQMQIPLVHIVIRVAIFCHGRINQAKYKKLPLSL